MPQVDYDMAATLDDSGNAYVSIWGNPSGKVVKWTMATNTWSTLDSDDLSTGGALVFDPVRRRLVYFGSSGGSAAWWTLAGVRTGITFSGAQASSGPGKAWFYNPDLDVFMGMNDSGAVVQCNPTTFAVTAYPVSGTPPASNGVSQYNKWQIDTALGVILAHRSYADTNLSAFRYK
jgi:hypothetical protein